MREIKFRCWNFDKNKIYEGGTERGNLRIIEESILCGYVLMQFTGLKDKNGKEIYEGDILKYGNRKYVVAWSRNFMFVVMLDNAEVGMLCEFTIEELEIIGNIYQDKELLK